MFDQGLSARLTIRAGEGYVAARRAYCAIRVSPPADVPCAFGGYPTDIGRCRWRRHTMVRGPRMGSQGDDRRGRRGIRAQGPHKASQARTWVCRAYVHVVSRLLGISNRGTMHGSKISRTSAEGGRGRRVKVCHSKYEWWWVQCKTMRT